MCKENNGKRKEKRKEQKFVQSKSMENNQPSL